MTEPLTPEELDALAAEYALGLTPPDEAAELRERTYHDLAFADAVALWQERLVALTDDIAPVRPPARAKKALDARLFGAGRVPWFQRVWLWQAVSAAALAMVAFLGLQQLQAPGPVPIFATQITGAETGLVVLAVYDPVRDGLALNRIAGEAPAGRVLEVWAIAPDAAPVSLGLLPESGMIHVRLPENLKAIAGSLTLAISDEPPGGSTTGAPTGAVLATGAVTEL